MLTSIWHCLALWTERAICQRTLLQQLKLKLRKSLILNTLCYCLYNTDNIIQIYPTYIFFRLHSQKERRKFTLAPFTQDCGHSHYNSILLQQLYSTTIKAFRKGNTNSSCTLFFSSCFFFPTCNSVAQSAKAVFTGSGCKTGDNKPHSAFRAHKMHIL